MQFSQCFTICSKRRKNVILGPQAKTKKVTGKKYIATVPQILHRSNKYFQFPEPMLVVFKELQTLCVTQKDFLYSDNTLVTDSEKTELSSANILWRGFQISFSSWEFSPVFPVTGSGTQWKARLFVIP